MSWPDFRGPAQDAGQHAYLRTDYNDYVSQDFTATITVLVPDNIFFFGVGQASSIVLPEPTAVIGTRSHSVGWGQ